MKKLYSIVLMALPLFNVVAQNSLRDKPLDNTSSPAINPAVSTSQSPTACDSLLTTVAAGNGNDGAMFNITALQNIIIKGFHMVFSENAGDTGYVKYYYRQGSYIGNEQTPGAWTFVDSALATSGGSGVAVWVPIHTSIIIPAGSKYGFYLTGNLTGLTTDYTNGSNEDTIYASNSFIQVHQGRGMVYPFSLSGVPRIFNGIVHTCPVGAGIEDQNNTTTVALYPNPIANNATFTISSTENIAHMRLQITDVLGNEVRMIKPTSSNIILDRDGISSGFYFYTLRNKSNASIASGKFIIK